MQGPVLPNATATPVGDSAGSAPPPVGTAGAPEAVTTSQPGFVPDPQATGEISIPDAQATKDALIALSTIVPPTAVVKPTEVPVPPTAVQDTGSSDGAIPGDVPTVDIPPVDAQPTEESKPTPAPTPVPAPNDGGATVDASSGDQSGGASGASADGGPVPSTNPATGGGRSDLTTWLGLAAALMMLGGWALRFKARTPVPVRAESNND